MTTTMDTVWPLSSRWGSLTTSTGYTPPLCWQHEKTYTKLVQRERLVQHMRRHAAEQEAERRPHLERRQAELEKWRERVLAMSDQEFRRYFQEFLADGPPSSAEGRWKSEVLHQDDARRDHLAEQASARRQAQQPVRPLTHSMADALARKFPR